MEFELQVIRFLIIAEKPIDKPPRFNIYYLLGHLFAFTMPIRSLGEVARIKAMSPLFKGDLIKTSIAIFKERVTDISTLVLFLIISLTLKYANNIVLPILIFTISIVPFAITKLLIPYLISIALWIVDALRVFLIFSHFNFSGSFLDSTISMVLSYFSIIFSVLPGGLIVFESTMVISSKDLFPSEEMSIAATMTERFFSFWLFILIGLPFYLFKLILFLRKEKSSNNKR
jgi:uncharacterized membrane protein YbhN (UPF0104 family)